MIETKTLVIHISCNFKCKFNSTKSNSNQKWNNKTCQCDFKNYCMCKKHYSWNPSTCICENPKCLKSTVDESNSDDKKVRYKMNCYIFTRFYQ